MLDLEFPDRVPPIPKAAEKATKETQKASKTDRNP
jgi:hypothetical protein